MNSRSIIIVNPRHDHVQPVAQRFHKTLQWGDRHRLYRLPHPERPAYAHGSSSHTIIHALGHGGAYHPPLATLQPHMTRTLSRATAHARQKKVPLHVVGMLDHSSPYGSQRILEPVVRFFQSTEQPIYLHLGVWHPTPQEVQQSIREIKSLPTSTVQIASVFPIQWLRSPTKAKKYLDGIYSDTPKPALENVTLPVQEPYYFIDSEVAPESAFVILHHELHDFDPFVEVLAETNSPVFTFESMIPLHPTYQQKLDAFRHIMTVTSRPSYEKAYFSHAPHHPYYESVHVPRGDEALEMLLSPHFGYGLPYETVVVIDEQGKEFDPLLSSFIKHNHDQVYYCCLLCPDDPRGSLLLTNQNLNSDASLYQQLHGYV